MIKLIMVYNRRLLGMVAVACTGFAAGAMTHEEHLFNSPVVWLLAAVLCVLWCIYGVLLELLDAKHVAGAARRQLDSPRLAETHRKSLRCCKGYRK